MDIELMSRLTQQQPIAHKVRSQHSNKHKSPSFLEELKQQIQNNSYYKEEIAEIIADKIVHNISL